MMVRLSNLLGLVLGGLAFAAACGPAQQPAPASPSPAATVIPGPQAAASPAAVKTAPSPTVAAVEPSPAAPSAASPSPAAAAPAVRVATSINVLADMVRNVGGSRVLVESFVPAGSDVHTAQLAPRNVQTIASADLVVLNGGGLEAAVEPAVRNNVRPGVKVVELFEAVPEERHIEEDEAHETEQAGAEQKPEAEAHGHEGANPHAWLDPELGARYVEAIREALIEADPAGRAVYEANARRYTQEIQAVDQQVQQQVQAIPPANRKLVTFHEAFPYMARHYGLEVVGVVVESADREPSAAQVAELVRSIRQQNVPAVFSEPQVDARVLELVARDAGVKVLPLYSDSLDERVKGYLELLRFNGQQLALGLG